MEQLRNAGKAVLGSFWLLILCQTAFGQINVGTVSGTVKVVDSNRVEDVYILVSGDSPTGIWVEKDGTFVLTLRSGRWKLIAYKDGYTQANKPQPAVVEIKADKSKNSIKPEAIELARAGVNRNGSGPSVYLTLVPYDPAQATPGTCEQMLDQLATASNEPGTLPPDPAQLREFSGKVVDAQTKRPLVGARVTITKINFKTRSREELGQGYSNASGVFSFSFKVSLVGKGQPAADADDRYLFAVESDGYNSCNRMVGLAVLQQIAASTVEWGIGKEDEAEERKIEETLTPLIETTEATRRYVFTPKLMEALPVAGWRSFDSFAFLAPGVLPPPETQGTAGPGVSAGVGTAGQFAVNGIRSRENNFTVDGSDNNDEDIGTRRQGFIALVPQAIETIQELQVITALADARFGRNVGGQINALTRYGTGQRHFSAYGFFTDRRLNAREFFDTVSPNVSSALTLRRSLDNAPVLLDGNPLSVSNPALAENPFTRRQIGATAGGKVKKIKFADVFYFASFENQFVKAQQEAHFAVPTVKQRGVFETGETGVRLGSASAFPASLPGNAVFSLYPFPNHPSGPYGENTYTTLLPADGRGVRVSAKLDYQFKGNSAPGTGRWRDALLKFGRYGDRISGRYSLTNERSTLPVTGGALFSSLQPRVRTHNVALFYNRTLSNTASDTFRFSFGRTKLSFGEVRDPFLTPSSLASEPFLLNAPLLLNVTSRAPGTAAPTQYISAASVAGQALFMSQKLAPATQTEQLTGPLGQLAIAGFSPLGVDVFNFPQARANNTFQVAHTLTVVSGNQIFTAGFDLRRPQINSTLPKNYRPRAVFGGLNNSASVPLTVPGMAQQPTFTGATLAAAGIPTGLFQTVSPAPDPNIGIRFTQANFFFQDEYRLWPNFRVNLGMRYELNSVPHTLNGRIEKSFNQTEVLRQVRERADVCRNNPQSAECQALNNTLSAIFPTDFRASFGGDRSGFNPRIGFAWDVGGKGKTALRAGWAVYNSPFQGIVVSHSRNAFPDFAPLNTANFSPRAQLNGATLTALFNLANPRLGQLSPALGIVQPGSLNTLLPTTNPVSILVSRFFNPRDVDLETYFLGLDLVLPQRKLKHPYSYQYGLTLEHEFAENWIAAISYVGTRGLKLLRTATPDSGLNFSRLNVSQVAPLSQTTGATSFPFFQGTLLPPEKARLISDFSSIARTFFESGGASIYNSLQVEVRRRYRRHLQLGTAFTYSHAIDTATDFFDTAGNFALPQNSFLPSERASAGFDIRTRSATYVMLDIPFKEKRWLGNWQVSGIATLQSGQPFTVNSARDVNGDGNLTDRLHQLAGLLSNPNQPDRRIQLQLAPGANAAQLLAPDGRDGAFGRNTFRAPGVVNFDMAITKAFRVSDEKRISFRAEVFNLLNRAHFGIPVRILEAPAFGQSVNTTLPARMIQLSVKLLF